jgi:hypothetical protein
MHSRPIMVLNIIFRSNLNTRMDDVSHLALSGSFVAIRVLTHLINATIEEKSMND